MLELVIEFGLVAVLSFLIGFGSSMVGISGGAFKTPVLIIIFGLSAQFSTGVALFSALFLAIPSTIEYNRNEKKPIMFGLGLLIALIAVPGLYIGVILKRWITEDYLFRMVFGVGLFPVAFMMLLTRRKRNRTDVLCEMDEYSFANISKPRKIAAGFGFLASGIFAGLFGLGGGTVNVPTMCLILGIPMLSAAATSVFVILFTSTAGTIMNLLLIPQLSDLYAFVFYSAALSVGAIIGSKLGADYACSIDGVKLKRFFGAILIFPLVHFMSLGQMWLDPLGTDPLRATLGDVVVWLLVVMIGVAVWSLWGKDEKDDLSAETKTS